MTEQEEDRLLRQALLDALRLDWEDVVEQAPPAAQSPKQEKRMRAMLADPVDYVRRVCRPLWKKVGRAVAGFFLTCTVTLGALMAASPTVRATVVRWVTEFYETHVLYRFSGEVREEEMPEYTIGELPAGYEDTEDTVESSGYIKKTYKNEHEQKLYLRSRRIEKSRALWIDADGMEIFDVQVYNCQGHVYLSSDSEISNVITWVNEKEQIEFSIDGFVDEETLLRMAQSVKKQK